MMELGGALAIILMYVGAFLLFFAVISLIQFLYFGMAMMSIAKKVGEKYPWIAWIPFANTAQLLHMGDFHWAWAFLLLGAGVPKVGPAFLFALLILTLISLWRVTKKREFPGWTAWLVIVPVIGWIWYPILIGILAWKK